MNDIKSILTKAAASVKECRQYDYHTHYYTFSRVTKDSSIINILKFFDRENGSTHMEMVRTIYPEHTMTSIESYDIETRTWHSKPVPYYGYARDLTRDLLFAGFIEEIGKTKARATIYRATDFGRELLALL